MPASIGYPATTSLPATFTQRAETTSTLRAAPESNTSKTETLPAERPEPLRRVEVAERRESNLGNNVDVFV